MATGGRYFTYFLIFGCFFFVFFLLIASASCCAFVSRLLRCFSLCGVSCLQLFESVAGVETTTVTMVVAVLTLLLQLEL